ncbi:MAG TPA: SGNH/GDSL hydrolase family protein [Solirubrobacteraceae bacterium]|jgi:lysophospholipase L1-like esterase|nr:SGNH/GDSL hydrolase family protein [Solirubrobacteraceae bacterium]
MEGLQGGTRATARRALTFVVLTACAALGLALVSAPALAKKPAKKPTASKITIHTPVTPGSGYLALGDSVTFGYEEQQVVPAPNYADAASFLGYPELLGSELHLTVANAACSGETSSSLIDATAPSNGCENSPGGGPGYRTMFPLHVKYSGSQLDYAVSYLKTHKNVRLVSLMIGANDFFLCQETTADHCASLPEEAAVGAAVSKNVKTILSGIRNKAHYGGQIAIVNYYSLNYSSAAGNEQSELLNSTQDTAAKPFHVIVVDGFGEFGAAAAHSGGNSCTAGLLTQLSIGGCGIHPSYAGQSLLAQALEKAIHIS